MAPPPQPALTVAPAVAHRSRGLLALAYLGGASAVYPNPLGFGGGGRNFLRQGEYNVHGLNNGPPPDVPFYMIIPFVLIIVGIITFMIWLIVSDERADMKKRENEKRARSLKYGKADPRYAE